MAIKVGGTTVIDDSRNISNVGGLKTVNGTSILGSGDIEAGASTDTGAVGTTIFGYTSISASGTLPFGSTRSGSSVYPMALMATGGPGTGDYGTGSGPQYAQRAGGQSGTWRVMGQNMTKYSNTGHTFTCFTRIS